MTAEMLTIDKTETPPAAETPQPQRKSGGLVLLLVILALVLFVLAVPVLVVVAVAGYFFLGASPAKAQPRPAREPAQVQSAPAERNLAPTAEATPTVPLEGDTVAVAPANTPAKAPVARAPHPLDEALAIAREGLKHMRANVTDYTANLVSRERIGGKLNDEQTMFLKIRSPKTNKDDEIVTPFSVYLKFTAPKDKAGREVIYVAGQNDDRLVAHETGIFNLIRVKLLPTGRFAMNGERYPITEIGLERLAEQLVERGEEERRLDPRITKVKVTVEKGIKFLDRKCTRIKMVYPHQMEQIEFHSAEVCIDEEHFVPIYYVAYSWPTKPGGEAVLEEQYTYQELKLNVGLKDLDFDPDNKEYKFP